jgi:hypothetical protein
MIRPGGLLLGVPTSIWCHSIQLVFFMGGVGKKSKYITKKLGCEKHLWWDHILSIDGDALRTQKKKKKS